MERYDLTKKVGIIGIIGNIFLFIIKIVIGVLSNSRAMIADALNSAGDVFASFMTWLGNHIALVPKDNDHNYGHGKAEYIFTMLIGISMIILSIKLLYDSILSIINYNKLIFSWKIVLISIITIITKLCLYLYTKSMYKKTGNLLVKSNMIDHRNDMVLTFLTLVAILFTQINIYFVDGIVGIIISIWIFISGIKLYKDSYDVLMDQAIDNTSQKKIIDILKRNNDIKKIGRIYSLPIGYKYIVVITIFVDGGLTTLKSHTVADKVEREIIKEIDKIEDVLVHVEPIINVKNKINL